MRHSAAIVMFLCVLAGCGKAPESEKTNSSAPPDAARLPQFGTMTITPNSGSGNEQVFQIKLPPGGESTPSLVGLLVNSQKLGEKACYVYARPEDNTFLLVNDNGEGSRPMESDSIANQQCAVLRDGSSVTLTDAGLTINARIRFTPAFSGFKRLYLIAYDQSQATDGLRAAGQWQIPGNQSR